MQTYALNIHAVRALARHIAPKQEVRYYLIGVSVEFGTESTTYCATDGHMLVAHKTNLGTEAPRQIILPRDFCMALKPRKTNGDFEMLTINDDGSIECQGVTGKLIDATFPNWRKIVPATVSGAPAVYNPRLQAAVLDCMGECMRRDPKDDDYLRDIEMNGDKAGIYTMPNTIGVIMPMRPYGKERIATPAWALPGVVAKQVKVTA